MSEKVKGNKFDNSLYILAEECTRSLKLNADGSDQKAQVELLMKLEDKFRKHILTYKQSLEIYKLFLQHIVVVNRHILSARPYFREKSDTFSKEITPLIKNANVKKLQKFHINYQLIKFIKDNWKGTFPEKAQILFDKIVEARRILIENNMPLAINRAKLFYRKVPENHLNLMDLIGIASMGLISGIDKYVGDYTPVFRSVCIGRMGGNMIESYSDTMLHFYPSDKHTLYRANSIAYREKIDDYGSLAEAINKSFVKDLEEGKKIGSKQVSPDELSSLMKAASTLSASLPFDSGSATIFDAENVMGDDPEEEAAHEEAMFKMIYHAKNLPLLQRKVLKLKGVPV